MSPSDEFGRRRRASVRILNMDPVAQEVCMVAGGDLIMDHEGTTGIMELVHGYFAPNVADSAHQEVARSLQFKRATHTTDAYFAHFNFLRRKVDPHKQMGGASREVFA